MAFTFDENSFLGKAQTATNNVKNKSLVYLKTHWVDYLIMFFVCLLLGAFDIFVLKKSDNLGDLNYWLHAGARLLAYVLSAILGIRIGYPKAKAICVELFEKIEENSKMIKLVKSNFGEFINSINLESKQNAWKAKINKKLAKLDKRSPDFFPLFYANFNNAETTIQDDCLKRYHSVKKREKMKRKAEEYCVKRATLEKLLTDEFISKNLNSISVNYNVIYKQDFYDVESGNDAFNVYKTRTEVEKSSSRIVVNSLLFSVIMVLLVGSLKLDFDKALFKQRALMIINAVISGIIDICFALGKFVNGFKSCETLVKQEDLRVAVDKNELLVRYLEQNGLVYDK